jgi:hypothetical protein
MEFVFVLDLAGVAPGFVSPPVTILTELVTPFITGTHQKFFSISLKISMTVSLITDMLQDFLIVPILKATGFHNGDVSCRCCGNTGRAIIHPDTFSP